VPAKAGMQTGTPTLAMYPQSCSVTDVWLKKRRSAPPYGSLSSGRPLLFILLQSAE